MAHLATAEAHGYLSSVSGAPAIIADGLRGGAWGEVEVGLPRLKTVKIAQAFLEADSLLVMSHFKGHEMTGFGGALKNLGMGFAPPIGKREQHAVKLFVREKKCVRLRQVRRGLPPESGDPGPGDGRRRPEEGLDRQGQVHRLRRVPGLLQGQGHRPRLGDRDRALLRAHWSSTPTAP